MKKIREINYLEERRELIIVHSYSDGLSVTVTAATIITTMQCYYL